MYEVDLRERIALALIAAHCPPDGVPQWVEEIVAAVLKPTRPSPAESS